MKKLVLVMSAFIAAWSMGAFADGVGVVDMKTIFSTSPKVKSIKAELSKQFEPQKNKLEKMGQSLQADIAKYQKNKAVMNQKDMATLEASITAQETAFRAAQTKFQQDVFNAQNKSLNDFMNSVKAAVKVVAEKQKLDLVVPSNDVLYTKTNTDITPAVLKDIK
ncbi:MAG: OmpH family outer membrane protein [Gammaproteobacteria bacterium]|nr:OmpH family outer membrane protein [Gammaproteobacteria bacterium]